MKVRIIKTPRPADLENAGFERHQFEVGAIYDLRTGLADYLVVGGWAAIEMRAQDRARDSGRRHSPDDGRGD